MHCAPDQLLAAVDGQPQEEAEIAADLGEKLEKAVAVVLMEDGQPRVKGELLVAGKQEKGGLAGRPQGESFVSARRRQEGLSEFCNQEKAPIQE